MFMESCRAPAHDLSVLGVAQGVSGGCKWTTARRRMVDPRREQDRAPASPSGPPRTGTAISGRSVMNANRILRSATPGRQCAQMVEMDVQCFDVAHPTAVSYTHLTLPTTPYV